MPEDSFEEKTEQPTPKRLRESREKGSVAKSAELNSAVILILGISFLYFGASHFGGNLMKGMQNTFLHIGEITASLDSVEVYYKLGLLFTAKVVGPFLLFILVLGLGVNVLQIGFLLTARPLEPDFTKLSPLKGIKNLVSVKGLVEGIKGIFKVAVVILIAYVVIKKDLPAIFAAADRTVGQIVTMLGQEMYRLAIIISVILLAMAFLDYVFQRWNHIRNLRMTKQEIKEERKQLEGDPMIKARIKSLQREMARRRMMDEVPQATVVVTNPTFIAIALQYEAAEMSAPKVVAKGKRLIAERIKKIATENGIPIVEDKPLARSLFDAANVGEEIPPAFFAAVAEILAYVFRLKNQKAA